MFTIADVDQGHAVHQMAIAMPTRHRRRIVSALPRSQFIDGRAADGVKDGLVKV